MRRTPGTPSCWWMCAHTVPMDGPADGRARQQRQRRRRRPRGSVLVVDPIPAAAGAQMLAQELAGRRRQQADVEIVPLHLHALPEPPGRRAVIRGLDFDAAIEMDGAVAEVVVAKRFDGERAERRPFLGKHRGDLALRRAVDARIGPVRFPAIQIRLRRFERLEAQAFQRRFLRVADAGFDFAFAIGIAHAARQGDDAVVREHVAIERIEGRVVDVWREHAFAQVVEHDDLDRAAQAGETPARGARPRSAHSIATSAGARICASSRASARRAACAGTCPVFGSRTIGPFAVVDLAFLARGGRDDHARFGRRGAAERQHEAPDTRVPRREAVVVDQVLPDGHGVAPTARAPRRSARGTARRRSHSARARAPGWPRVGGHLPGNGRF